MTIKVIARILFAASAMAFACLIVCFLVVLVAFGLDHADKVWSGIYPILAWLVALLICSKFMRESKAP
ncbi:hypothetical protein [Xanthomonas vesicatoria]|uniref:hypothetical protein n=1 Tax=Xanthomonas vesicatoria TaxID=56460 RepID=UPI0013DEB7F8|nr:hypothetical protein [Xanthomonas vesicatoria]MCC8557673.1 hypothetical protein [Xanthomonas vesicatoria]MCC8599998.1 hypothetical protein [Xanthomonas vesicatoria]MCC8609088.1 hypothetical protein [Xanthomonas vesicatoria]MCC8674827.1 hypothetical protein [Xanthomonas vesicatoria]MCC8677367.1 hypothetical protein [Xanthomonas vesicatoria]